MNIDWFTFFAQIFNFLVLVGLLSWLLYGPVVRAMRQREQNINDRLEEAEARRREAEEQGREFERRTAELERRRDELLEEARQDADEQRERLLREARAEVDRQRQQWQQALDREQQELLAELRQGVGRLSVQAARRTLAELADVDLERRMADVFTARLRQLKDTEREEILHHLSDGGAAVSVRTAHEVSDEQRQRLREAIHQTFKTQADVAFQRDDDLICGLELDVGGYSFGWNVREFLDELNWDFAERLREPAAARTGVGS